MYRLISQLTILLHWSVCLSFCQYHTVSIIVTLYKSYLPFLLWKCKPFNFVLFQDCLGYSGSFAFLHEFQDQLVKKKKTWDFDRNCIESQVSLRSSDILTTLSPSIHECKMSFHLFRSSFVSMFCSFVFLLISLIFLLINLFLSILFFLRLWELFSSFHQHSVH